MTKPPAGSLEQLRASVVPLTDNLPEISDEMMRESRAKTRSYAIAILKKGPGYDPPRSDSIIWEHGRRNYALRAAKLLVIVCPIPDKSELAGISIFDADADTVQRIMSKDPAVKAGVLTFEVHPALGFPGDCLPAGPITRGD